MSMAGRQSISDATLSRSESDAIARKRRGRNIALAVALLALVGLFYALAMVKLGAPLAASAGLPH